MHFWGRNLLLRCFKGGIGHTQMVGKGAVELQGTAVTAAGLPEASPALGAAQCQHNQYGISHAHGRAWPEHSLAILGCV